MKLIFSEFAHKNYNLEGDYKVYQFVINIFNDIKYKNIDLEKSYLELFYGDDCHIYLYSNCNDVLDIYIWLSYFDKNIYLGFENNGEICIVDYLDEVDSNIFSNYLKNILKLRFTKEIWGVKNKYNKVIYFTHDIDKNIFYNKDNRTIFTINSNCFWKKNQIISKTNYKSYID